MTGSNAAEIITANIDAMLDGLEFGEAMACYERLQRFMERKKLEIETLAEDGKDDDDPELDFVETATITPNWYAGIVGPKPRNKLKEQQLARAVEQSVTRCGPVNGGKPGDIAFRLENGVLVPLGAVPEIGGEA